MRVALIALLCVGCAATPARPDPAPSPACAEPTSPADVDSFINRLLTAAARNPSPTRSFASRFVYLQFAELRARLLAGSVVLDPGPVEWCLSHVPTMSEHEYFDAPGGACAAIARPRCPAPVGTPCAIDAECDPELFCDGPEPSLLGGAPCLGGGHCAPRIVAGGVCPLDAWHACAPPDSIVGTSLCAPSPADEPAGRCGTATLVAHTDGACGLVTMNQGAFEISICEPPLVCANQVCRALNANVQLGGTCDFDAECGALLYCDRYARQCIALDGPCGPGACPMGYVCGDDHCVASDGRRGSPCEPASCNPGLACRDGVCGASRPDGEVTNDELECASSCAAPSEADRTRRCTARR